MAEDCGLNNNAKGIGCQGYEGTISGMFIKSVPFSYSPANLILDTYIKGELVAADDRLHILIDKDDYESIQNREARSGQAASGKQLFYGMTPHAFALKERRPRPYDIRTAFLDGGGSQKVYGMPFTNKGFINPNLVGGMCVSKEYDMTKLLLEAVDYSTGEKMLKYIFTEYSPEQNTQYHESIKPVLYDPNNLDGVNDVVITMISASATSLVCTIALAGETTNNISTLVTANFRKLTGAGVVEAVTAAYSATTGRYTLSGTGMVTGTLQVIAVATDAVFYESAATTVTVA